MARPRNRQHSGMVMQGEKSPQIALGVNEVSQYDVGKLWWKGVNRPLQPPRPWKMAPVRLRALGEAECSHSKAGPKNDGFK